MLFNTYQFILIFLPITLLAYYLINLKTPKYSYLFILLTSIIFYSLWDIYFLSIIFISIITNFQFGLIIKKTKKKIYLIFGILIQIFTLCYFKYKNFFLENFYLFTNDDFQLEKLILPLGISFFTFKHIMHLLECYNDNHKKNRYSLLSYATYITFFPHLIAGPLSKPSEIIPQLLKNSPITLINFNLGLAIFFIGLFKKIVLADTFAIYSNDPFSAVENGYMISFVESWLAMICFSLQIYFDFSGYTDMAIGLAKILNVSFPINFYSPYKSKSIIEFWKRWHITLSRFLKDCIYIPLGGNRKGKVLSFIFIIITMLLGGFWHGASWNFVLWGLFHAILIIINHMLIIIFKNKTIKQNLFIDFTKIIFTYLLVSIGWIIFKLKYISSIKIFFQGLVGYNGFKLNPNLQRIVEKFSFFENVNFEFINIYYYGTSQLIFIFFGLFIVFFMPNTIQLMKNYNIVLKDNHLKKFSQFNIIKTQFKFSFIWSIFLAFLTICAITGMSNETKEFIYYQF